MAKPWYLKSPVEALTGVSGGTALKALGSAAKNPALAYSNTKNRINDSGLRYAFMPQRAYAAESSQPNGGYNISGQAMTYEPSSDGGWNFFVDGRAASYQDYKNAGGQDPVVGGDAGTSGTTESGTTVAMDGGAGGTGDGGTAPVPTFNQYWNGQLYTDPTAYTNAVNDTILTNYKAQQKKIDDLYNSGIIGLDEKLQMGRENLTSLKKSRDDSMKSIQGYFNRISPDAVQSEQGTLQGNVETEYGEKKGKVGTLFDGKSASEIAGMDLNPYINEISTTGQIARAAKGLNTQKADQMAANDQYKTSATDQTANNLLDLKNNISAPSAGDIVSEYMNRLEGYGAGGTDTKSTNMVGGQTTDQFGNPINPDDDNYWNS